MTVSIVPPAAAGLGETRPGGRQVVADRLVEGRLGGVLDQRAGQRWFDAARYQPAPGLTDLIEHCWRVRWDMDDHGPYTQHTLSNVSVHLVVEHGRCRVQGIVTGRFTRVLEGRGRVFGVKFRPAGFHPFLASAVSALTDRSVAIRAVFGRDGADLAARVLALEDDDEIMKVLDTFFEDRRPAMDPDVTRINEIVASIVADRTITRVEHVARTAGIGVRTLQRLFGEYVGVSPKWVIGRYRLHEAEARLSTGEHMDLVTLALELGYYDQAHFARDFRAIVGQSPAAYAQTTNAWLDALPRPARRTSHRAAMAALDAAREDFGPAGD